MKWIIKNDTLNLDATFEEIVKLMSYEKKKENDFMNSPVGCAYIIKENEQLKEENKELKEEVEKWKEISNDLKRYIFG